MGHNYHIMGPRLPSGLSYDQHGPIMKCRLCLSDYGKMYVKTGYNKLIKPENACYSSAVSALLNSDMHVCNT